jgi:ubiquitin-protein ligase
LYAEANTIAFGPAELQKSPVDGFSAGLVDDENILEWQIVIMG